MVCRAISTFKEHVMPQLFQEYLHPNSNYACLFINVSVDRKPCLLGTIILLSEYIEK